MLKAPARDLCPRRGIRTAGAQIDYGAAVAQPLHGLCKSVVAGHEPLEILAADLQEIDLTDGSNGGGARPAAEQRHLAERLSRPELGELVLGSTFARHVIDKNLNISVRDNEKRAARSTCTE